ncbi:MULTISPECIES: fasciclin domain-containing protein [unclassified Mycobacterium]|uniref:fasciclin domain-containing protein n=1 Tax=unclassified Mycobacterium TaxID=2642494 RepID=UPI0029C8F88C|nr:MULTISPECIES: fasciclin domain-containing protein [unclassified Mycobacterium]
MKTRTSKTLGVSAAIAAIAVSLPLAITAQADPPPPEPTAIKPPPDPQGPGCDPIKADLATAGLTWTNLDTMPVGAALAKIPAISTFTAAVSGGLNPAVNIVPVLENGPYVVFAPTNDAFAALDPAQLEALKADPAALTSLDYYHVFLGLLANDDVQGTRPSQQGTELTVKGKGGDIKVNDSAKMICGAIQASNARIYVIDTVLDKTTGAEAAAAARAGTTLSSTATTTTTTSAPAPAPAG